MKKYVVVRHSDGLFITIMAQFDCEADAHKFAELAATGNPICEFVVYKQC